MDRPAVRWRGGLDRPAIGILISFSVPFHCQHYRVGERVSTGADGKTRARTGGSVPTRAADPWAAVAGPRVGPDLRWYGKHLKGRYCRDGRFAELARAARTRGYGAVGVPDLRAAARQRRARRSPGLASRAAMLLVRQFSASMTSVVYAARRQFGSSSRPRQSSGDGHSAGRISCIGPRRRRPALRQSL